ncbi:hypothetical protein CHAN_09875 [Corynebacterium hansenii]|nr:hypothetical protein CHAN_09875 [Corynebacterium hansenii]
MGRGNRRTAEAGTGRRDRTPEDLWHELRTRGSVTLEARIPGHTVAGMAVLAIAVLVMISTTMVFANHTTSVFADRKSVIGPGFIATVIFGLGLVAVAVVRQSRRRARGSWWTIDRRGITVDGVGPVPWSDVEPTTRRMERALHDEGRTLTLVMPLNEAGMRRAAALPPEAGRALDPGLRQTVFGKDKPTMIRVPVMKEMKRAEFARFLDGALEMAWRGRF